MKESTCSRKSELRTILFLTLLTILLCSCNSSNSGSSGALRGVNAPLISERTIHDEESMVAFGDFAVFRLEGEQRHSGDIGETGSDQFLLIVEDGPTRTFQMSPEDSGLYTVDLRNSEGETLATLDGGSRSAAYLSSGEYEVSINRVDQGIMPLAVFYYAGRFARSCESCLLEGINLTGINLSGLSFRGSDLRSAVLASTDCQQTDFSGSDLQGAMISGSNCQGANFTDANVMGLGTIQANLDGAQISSEQQQQIAQLPRLVLPTNRAEIPDGLKTRDYIDYEQSSVDAAGWVINQANGGSTSGTIEVLTLWGDSFIDIKTPVNLEIETLYVVKDGANPYILVTAENGADGADGANGANGQVVTLAAGSTAPSQAPTLSIGADGEDGSQGKDGNDTPSVFLNVGKMMVSEGTEGTLELRMQTASGGNGGNGGNGGDGGHVTISGESQPITYSNAGNGGNGGKGGSSGGSGMFNFTYSSTSGVTITSNSGNDSEPGMGGLPGVGGSATGSNGKTGEVGDFGDLNFGFGDIDVDQYP